MPEAEDVIVGAARHATSYAMDLWRRNRVPDQDAGRGLALRDLRGRLELLIEGALGVALRIRTAAPPPPPTLLQRMMGSASRSRARRALPATDGLAVFLPSRFEAPDIDHALDLYRIAALEQAMRCARGTAAAFPWTASRTVQDLFLISEAAAAHAQLKAACPGLVRAMRSMCNAMASERPVLESLPEPLRAIEALYQSLLTGVGSPTMPMASTPAASLAWAREMSAQWPRVRAYPGLAGDALLGEVLKADAARTGSASGASSPPHDATPLRSAQLTRRPRARQAAEDEDDEQPGMWMVQTTEPSEHVEDPMGLQRPVDQEPDADLQGVSESIGDLEELRLVSTPGTSREVLLGEDELAPAAPRADSNGSPLSGTLAYPEWDYRIGAYRGAANVRVEPPREGSGEWVERTLAQHSATLKRVRRRFEALRARRTVTHGEPEGHEVDLDAFVSAYGERRARLPRTDRLYLAHRRARLDFALLVLIDTSGSTDAWVGSGLRIIDVEKEALVVVSTALEALRVRFAIHAFTGHGPADVRVRHVKSFEEHYDRTLARRIASLEPDEYTRAGAALRHATATLMREPAARRLLLILSDAKPNDCDHYEGRFGIEDTRQALAEARLQGIAPFCVTVDRQASRHLPLVLGAGNYTIVRDPPQLAGALLEWLRAVTMALQ